MGDLGDEDGVMLLLMMMMIIVQNLDSEFHQLCLEASAGTSKDSFFRIGRGGSDSPSCNDDITYGQAAVSSARLSRRIPNSESEAVEGFKQN